MAATVINGLTAAAIHALISNVVVGARYNESNHLILTLRNGSEIDAGVATAEVPPGATTSVAGLVELATTAEAQAGTSTTTAVTPSGLKAVADTKANASHSHAYADITGKPTLAAVATSGSYNDLLNKPATTGAATWSTVTGKPDWAVDRYAALRRWYSALANRHYAPVKIAVLGDSLGEGAGATVFGRGWVPQLLSRLRTKFPTTGAPGGAGFVATWDNPGYGGAAPSYTYVVSQNSGGYSTSQGFGLKSNTLLATGDRLSYTFTGTSVHVWYILQSTGGSFSVTIDGTVVAASVSSTGTLGRGVWSSATLTSGTHTILVTRIAGGGAGSILVTGFRVFDGDETKGIQMFNGSQSGLTSTQMATTPTNGDKWAPWINTIQPNLVIIELGLNDWSQNIPMATLKTNLKTIISTVRAQTSTDPSIVIYAATEANSGSYSSTYTQLHTVWEEVVAEDSKTALFDVAARVVAPRVDNTDGLYYDLLHPSDKGHATIAEHFCSFLSPM